MTRQIIAHRILPHLTYLTPEQLDAVAYIVSSMAARNTTTLPANVTRLPVRTKGHPLEIATREG